MNLFLSEQSRNFLKKNLPEAFNAQSVKEILEMLYDLINEKGFAPPDFEEYNDFGRQAQMVYDDIYQNNE